MFESGSLHWPAGGIILNEQHNRQAPILRFTPELVGNELRIDAPLPGYRSAAGTRRSMVRNGTLTGLSIEFRPELEGRAHGMRTIRRGYLGGAALGGLPLARFTSVEVRAKLRIGKRPGGGHAMAIAITGGWHYSGDSARVKRRGAGRSHAPSRVCDHRDCPAPWGRVRRRPPRLVLDEATVRLVGYLFDIPYATRGSGFSNHLRFSGAARILLPYVDAPSRQGRCRSWPLRLRWARRTTLLPM